MVIERPETKPVHAICGANESVNSNRQLIGIRGDGHFKKVVELSSEKSWNLVGNECVFQYCASNIIAVIIRWLERNEFGEIIPLFGRNKEPTFIGNVVLASALVAARYWAMGGSQLNCVCARVRRSHWVVSILIVRKVKEKYNRRGWDIR